MVATVASGFGFNVLSTALILLVCVTCLWMLSIQQRDISIIDIFWGPGFAIVAIVSYLLSQGTGVGSRRLLLTLLTVMWGVRLGGYIGIRNHGRGEDPRYTAAYRRGGIRNLHLHTLIRVYLLQGALVWIISVPVQLGAYLVRPTTLGIPALLGALLWFVGFLFEAVSDAQLSRFKADPRNRGHIMDKGLWRYTRHPNYFGNSCVWWGLWLIACDHWIGVFTVFAPLLMTHFLLNVTGKRLLEKRMTRTRPGYSAYVARTSGFFPWPPRAE